MIMIKRFCTNCGKEMFVEENSCVSLCEDCKNERKKMWSKRSAELTNKRKKDMNLVTINVYAEDRDKLKAMSNKKVCAMAEIVKEIMKNY